MADRHALLLMFTGVAVAGAAFLLLSLALAVATRGLAGGAVVVSVAMGGLAS